MKKLFMCLLMPLFLEAESLNELFTALKTHATVKSDILSVQKTALQKEMIQSSLYPKVSLFASYDNYNEATGLLPVAPNELLDMVKDQNVAQPFSTNIYREGARFSMPIYVKSIYTTGKQAEAMYRSVKMKKYISLLENEALIVSANANFLYLESLEKSLKIKEASLLEAKKTVQIKVNNGRSSASSLYKIIDSLNEVSIGKNNIELEKQRLISSIEGLTGIRITESVKMQKKEIFQRETIDSLKPLQEKIKADRFKVRAEKEKLYPTLYAHGSYVLSQAAAYNNDKQVYEKYGNLGITLNIPLLDMTKYDAVALAEVELQSSQVALEKLQDTLGAKAAMLKASLDLLHNSIKLYQESIENKKQLLTIAKVNYKSGRLSTEEYLRYEDTVVAQESKLYKAEAMAWQTEMELAVIYVNNIEEMVE